jgi:hypothetical protein
MKWSLKSSDPFPLLWHYSSSLNRASSYYFIPRVLWPCPACMPSPHFPYYPTVGPPPDPDLLTVLLGKIRFSGREMFSVPQKDFYFPSLPGDVVIILMASGCVWDSWIHVYPSNKGGPSVSSYKKTAHETKKNYPDSEFSPYLHSPTSIVLGSHSYSWVHIYTTITLLHICTTVHCIKSKSYSDHISVWLEAGPD